MKKKRMKLVQLLVLALLLIPLMLPSQALADDEIPDNPYYQVTSAILEDGTELDEIVIAGPPEPPEGIERIEVRYLPPNLPAGINIIPNVPAFSWSFGCSATSASMIAGYYDRNGYPNMYAGPTNDSIMPLNNSVWGVWVHTVGSETEVRAQCPLSATRNGVDGRTTAGHVDDFWVWVDSSDADPYLPGTHHSYGDCTGDYMKTNQSAVGNVDGGTTFVSYTTSGNRLTCATIAGSAYADVDGTNGFQLFYESRGYTVDASNCYNQKTDNAVASGGFSFADYMAEIDAGYPVMLHVTGHTMVGVGYNSNTNTVILHDTWDYSQHTMPWGGDYVGMTMQSVSVLHLDPWEHNSAITGNWNTGSTWDAGTVPTIGDDVTIREDHTVTLNTNAHVRNLTIQYGATLIIPDGFTLTVEENLYNNGLMQQTQDVPVGSTTEFFHIQNNAGTADIYHGVDITPETANALGSTLVELRGNHTNGCTSVEADALVNRCIRIRPGSDQDATIRFWFTEDERNSQNSSTLSVWHYDSSWTSVGSSLVRSESGSTCTNGTPSGFGCYVEAQGISTYSPFGIGSGAAPTAITLRDFDTRVGPGFYIALFISLLFVLMGVGALLYRRRKI